MYFIVSVLLKIIEIYQIIILISVVLSWLDRHSEMWFTKFIRQLTDPYLNRLRIVIPIGGMYLDLAPVIGLLLLQLIGNIISRIFFAF